MILRLAITLCSAIVVATSNSQAQGCAPSDYESNAAYWRENATHIFSGKVTKIEIEDADTAFVRFKVNRTYRGRKTRQTTFDNVNTWWLQIGNVATCPIPNDYFQAGRRYLVYAIEWAPDRFMYSDMQSGTKLLKEASEELRMLGKGRAPRFAPVRP